MGKKPEPVLPTEKLLRIREIVSEELDLDISPTELDERASFADDYDADSLSIIQIVARLERELAISLPRDRLGEVVSLRRLHELVAEAGHA